MAFEDLAVDRQRRLLRSLLDDFDPEIYPEFYVISDSANKGSGWTIRAEGLDYSFTGLAAWDGKFTDGDIQDLTEAEYLRMEPAPRLQDGERRRAYKCSLRPRATRERAHREAPAVVPSPSPAPQGAPMQWGIPRIPPGAVIMVPAAGQEAPTETSPLPQLGKVFAQYYEILEHVGQGGMGVVYKARDTRLDDVVAIKTLPPQAAHDPHRLKRFQQEIKLARKVTHPAVCRIYEYGHVDELPYFSMEFIDGQDIKKRIERDGPIPYDTTLDIMSAVVEGLVAIHHKGIVHRDLKSRNIMLDSDGAVRIMDFGIAKDDAPGSDHTNTGQLVGSLEYMSPERLQDRPADCRSDIYSVGIVFYEMLKGRPPFQGKPEAILAQHLTAQPDLGGIPSPAVQILTKALAKNPEERYSSATALGDALRTARAPEAPPADPQAQHSVGLMQTILAAITPQRSYTKQQLGEAILLVLYDQGAYGHEDVPIQAFTKEQAQALGVPENEISQGLRYLEAKGWFEYTTVLPSGQLTREGLTAAETLRATAEFHREVQDSY